MISCCMTCERDSWCRSFSFNLNTKNCTLFSDVFMAPQGNEQVSSGTVYFTGMTALLLLRSIFTSHSQIYSLSLTPDGPHSSVGSVADLRIGGRWFYPPLSQYSFRGLMIVIATGFLPLSPLSVVSTMVMWESSQWLGKNIVLSTG